MRHGQKIAWTRSELRKFEELDDLEYDAEMMAEPYLASGVIVGSKGEEKLEKIGSELKTLRKELCSLMGRTRFDILMNDRFTRKAWRDEIWARYITKHPWLAPLDCRPGWE